MNGKKAKALRRATQHVMHMQSDESVVWSEYVQNQRGTVILAEQCGKTLYKMFKKLRAGKFDMDAIGKAH